MKCPHCNSEVELTWKRYWTSPTGNHQCPSCEELFRLKHSLRYYAAIVGVAAVLGVVFAVLAKVLVIPVYLSLIGYCVICLVFIIPLDRWIDARWRTTIPVEKKDAGTSAGE